MYVLKSVVEKDNNWWIAPWSGDPGRTLKIENAQTYSSQRAAAIAISYYKNRYSHVRKIKLEINYISSKP